MSVCYSALAQSALNFTLTLWSTKIINQPTLVGAVQLLFPLFALVLSYFALHESLSPFAGLGGAVVVAGLLLILRDRNAERKAAKAAAAGGTDATHDGYRYSVLESPLVAEERTEGVVNK